MRHTALALAWGWGFINIDGDGVDEIYGPYHSGAGGAHAGCPIMVLEQDKAGRYDLAGVLDGYDHRAGLYLTQIDGGYYFLVNPMSDPGGKVFDIDIIRYMGKGRFQMASLACGDFRAESVAAYTHDSYVEENDLADLLGSIRAQALDAIDMSRRSLLYSPEDETASVSTYSEQGRWSYSDSREAKDVRFERDFDNDGHWEQVIKGHYVDNAGKYYFDIFRVDVFETEQEAAASTPVNMTDITGLDYYGRVGVGNIYDLLPVHGDICQLWIAEDALTQYTVALTRREMTYTLYVFLIEGKQVTTLHKELFLDEFHAINVTFEASDSMAW